MQSRRPHLATNEIREALRGLRRPILAAAAFSAFVNLLMLSGPLFMLLVYDRVLPSHSTETLLSLLLLITLLYAILAIVDWSRAQIMGRVAARLQSQLDGRVFAACLNTEVGPTQQQQPLHDLEHLQRALAAPLALAALDLPWVPLFLGAIFLLHPLIGYLALAGGAVLLGLAIVGQQRTNSDTALAGVLDQHADRLAHAFRGGKDTLFALGMQGKALEKWQFVRRDALLAGMKLRDIGRMNGSVTRAFRLYLQSCMLALAAWLCIAGEVSAGSIVASSVLMGRMLAPIETLVAGWATGVRALQAHGRLRQFLSRVPAPVERLPLPQPRPFLKVRNLCLHPAGTPLPTLENISFGIGPGNTVAVVGPSGAGKTSLLRACVGLVTPGAGTITLDESKLSDFGAALGLHLGYMPQRPGLFPGTIAENIARLGLPDPEQVVHAARAAGVHVAISKLPRAYDTDAADLPHIMSGGAVQRICLARALYGAPNLLVLDEPDAGLDAEALACLVATVRQHAAAGGAVLLSTHRMSLARECERVLSLDQGQCLAFGATAKVLSAGNVTAPIPLRRRTETAA